MSNKPVVAYGHLHFFYSTVRSGVILILFLLTLLPTPSYALSGAIAQSYETANADIVQGALVSLAHKNTTTVTASNSSNASDMVGVAASNPLIELSSGGQNSVQVVVGGTAEALVVDLNGQVMAGDKITASPISGIGMKAVNSSEIVGIAQADLSSVKTVTRTFIGTNGKQVSAKVGLLPLTIEVSYYSATANSTASSIVPPFLQDLFNAVAGKAVSPFRILASMLALILGFGAIFVMLSTAIRSGVISLGRNPLAANVLRRGMADVLLAALGVLVVTVLIVTAIIAL